MYSYIAPIVTKVDGPVARLDPVFLLVFGIGSVFGSWAAGLLADWNVETSVLCGFAATVVVLVLFFFAAAVRRSGDGPGVRRRASSARSSRSTCRCG